MQYDYKAIRRKVLWPIAGCAIAAIMSLAACAPSASPGSTTQTPPAATSPSSAASTVQSQEKPQYGGTYTEIEAIPIQGFDPLVHPTNSDWSLQLTQDTLLSGDWSKGPAGTGQTDWEYGILGNTGLYSGQLATSWEIPNDHTIIYHLRQGVHWMTGRAGNGRELTASDVAWSMNTEWHSPGTNFSIFFQKADRLISANATDKYTVVLDVPPQAMADNFLENSSREFIRDPDVTQKYGNQSDWRNMDTTGPFYITDYVQNSEMDFAKNPIYWEKNPIGPGKGDQLPYVDNVKWLLITDTSTQLAAFRTGKVDLMKNMSWDDYTSMIKEKPSIQWKQVFGSILIPTGREDKSTLPFKNLLVRQALNLAVNQQAILSGYYHGQGVLMGWPFYPTPAYNGLYMPLNQMPSKPTAQGSQASPQELYTYDPTKAKQLLTEAGYPNGFQTNIVVSSAGDEADYASMVKQYLAKVGVDMTIETRDPTTYENLLNNRTFDQMILMPTTMWFLPYELHSVRADSAADASFFQDSQSLAAYQSVQDNLARNDSAWMTAVKDVTPHLIEEAWGIWMPAPYLYNMWWPWVKNFDDEVNTGYGRFERHVRYLWIDQNLRKSMGY